MVNKLSDRLTAEELADKLYEQSKHMIIKKPELFKDWFIERYNSLGKEKYFGARSYVHCYNVYRRINDSEQDYTAIITGKPGIGKSYFAAQLCAVISPQFKLFNIHFNRLNMLKDTRNDDVGNSILIDEAILDFMSAEAMTKKTKSMVKIMLMDRQMRRHRILCIPSLKDLHKTARLTKANILINIETMGEPRYYLPEAMNIIEQVYPSKPIADIKIPKNSFFDDKNNNIFPTINDVNVFNYKKHKRDNYYAFMDKLIQEAEEDDGVDSDYLTLPDIAKKYNRHYRTVHQWVQKGILQADKIGGSLLVHKDSLDKFHDKDLKNMKNIPYNIYTTSLNGGEKVEDY